MNNYPAGVSTRDIDQLCPQGDTGATDECSICKRALEYDANRGFWRFDDIMGEPAEVVSGKHGDKICGPRCHSQYVFNSSTEQERDDMRLMAQMCDAWLKVGYTRRQWGFWSYSQLSINPGMLDDEINSLMAAFGMEDGENPPAWYVAATTDPTEGNRRLMEVVAAPVVPAKPVGQVVAR